MRLTTLLLPSAGGFVITLKDLPSYGLGLFYLSPFSWSVRSIALNEFGSYVSGQTAGAVVLTSKLQAVLKDGEARSPILPVSNAEIRCSDFWPRLAAHR